MGTAVKLIGKGLASNKVYEPILTLDQLASLETSPETESFDDEQQLIAELEDLVVSYDPVVLNQTCHAGELPFQIHRRK